jgi:hypothetical protein
MSDEMAQKKIDELKAAEELQRKQLEETKDDRCPSCATHASKFLYVNRFIVSQFGWLECPVCGTVFCPMSIRKQKFQLMPKPDDTKSNDTAVVPPG